MTNLPPAIEAARLAAVNAYDEKLAIETAIQYALNSDGMPTNEQFAELERARKANAVAHAELHKAISRGNGEQLEPEPPSWIPVNPDVHAQERKGRR